MGHSTDFYNRRYGVEFDDFEETLRKITALDVNIWSATNMEVYDYINAVNNLEISEDKTKVYNNSDVNVYAVIILCKVIGFTRANISHRKPELSCKKAKINIKLYL